MKTKEKTVKVSPECYKELLNIKRKTKVPIKHIIENLVNKEKDEFVN